MYTHPCSLTCLWAKSEVCSAWSPRGSSVGMMASCPQGKVTSQTAPIAAFSVSAPHSRQSFSFISQITLIQIFFLGSALGQSNRHPLQCQYHLLFDVPPDLPLSLFLGQNYQSLFSIPRAPYTYLNSTSHVALWFICMSWGSH